MILVFILFLKKKLKLFLNTNEELFIAIKKRITHIVGHGPRGVILVSVIVILRLTSNSNFCL